MSNDVQTSGLEELKAQIKEQGEALARLCEAMCTLTAEVTRLREAQVSALGTLEKFRELQEERDDYLAAVYALTRKPFTVSEEELVSEGDGAASFRELIESIEAELGGGQ
jgi:septal ring factor EnvC (AmiA/AmiB activator)